MPFTHRPLQTPLPELTAEMRNGRRYYTTPEGNAYPSITTVLSNLKKDALAGWRERVGEDEANRISEHAASRGTDLHAALEQYLKNEEVVFPDDPRSRVKIMFQRMRRVLKDVDNIVAQEVPLYSDELRLAGRTDLFADYKGVPSVIDFKGSTKGKKKDWIDTYFMQGTGYTLMFEERTGIKVEQIVILMCGEEDFSCQVFIETRDKWVDKLKEAIELFRTTE